MCKLEQRAIRKAQQSNCKFKVSALGLNRDGICVCSATNQSRFSRYGGGIHAEMRIMAQAAQKGVKTILICRVGKGGDLRPIDPCPVCAKTAAKKGIKIITVKGRDDTDEKTSDT